MFRAMFPMFSVSLKIDAKIRRGVEEQNKKEKTEREKKEIIAGMQKLLDAQTVPYLSRAVI